MSRDLTPFWHRESFDRFLDHGLPGLLAERLPLAGYEVAPAGDGARRITVAVTTPGGVAEVIYEPVPIPDEEGIFRVEGRELTVVPIAATEHLDRAEVACVGELLLAHIEKRLGRSTAEMEWTAELLRSWLPLDRWMADFLSPEGHGRILDTRNWLSRCEHSRRLLVPERQEVAVPGQIGRACPIQTPEGPNVGKVLAMARGAEIQDGRVRIVEEGPVASLSVAAAMIPFLEHDDPARALMGSNMMRQWSPPPHPEPALVRTGLEPDAPDFWCGRDLLTAFVSLGGDTFEDGIVVSESGAARLDWPGPLEPGDKISNRHGSKGVVSRILPDSEMPHLADGTPVELAFNFLGCHARRNFGQIREAVLGRIARAEGDPVLAAPFAGPGEEEIRRRLREAGLPETGMETLRLGKDEEELPRPVTVGWVYWSKTAYLATTWIRSGVHPEDEGLQRQDELEYFVLRDAGAFENLAETFNTRSADREDAGALADRVASGPVEQASPPSPAFAGLCRRLRAAGIEARFEGGEVSFAFADPPGKTLKLARPIPHPWLPERPLARIGLANGRHEAPEVREANERLRRMVEGRAPESLTQKTVAALFDAVRRWMNELLTPRSHLLRGGGLTTCVRFGGRVLFSGRAVVAPGPEYPPDRIGLAEEIAWTLFGPLVARRIGGGDVRERSEAAARVLDEVMDESWVLLNRIPSIQPTTMLAFRPVRIPDHVIRLPLLACWLLNADFDGDQAAVYLPVTEAAQREAGGTLSIAAHLARDPSLLPRLLAQDIVFGLAERSRTPEGAAEIADLAGGPVGAPDGYVTKETLGRALRRLSEREGVPEALAAADRLLRRGFEIARTSGASLSPFPLDGVDRPESPTVGEAESRETLAARFAERIASRRDFDDPFLGPQLLAVQSGARGTVSMLTAMLASPESGATGCGYAGGLDAEEYLERAARARSRVARVSFEFAQDVYEVERASKSKGFNVLARAMRAPHAGIVFAQAASTGEVDPLLDLDSRLFVGLGRPVARNGG